MSVMSGGRAALVLAGAVAGVMVTSAAARRPGVHRLDAAAFAALNGLPDRLHFVVWPVMQGGSLAAVPATGVVCYRLGRRYLGFRIAAAGLCAWLIAKPIKKAVGRDRPAKYLENVSIRGEPQTGLGFPAGHAAVAAAMATAAGPDLGAPGRYAAACAAVAVAASRVYVGAHLPLDAVGGLCLGAAVGIVAGRVGRG